MNNISDYEALKAFENSLQKGSKVTIHWTCSHQYFEGPATIEKINAKSFIATLDEDVGVVGMKYPKGQKIKAPRIPNGSCSSSTYSPNNCVKPRLPPLEEVADLIQLVRDGLNKIGLPIIEGWQPPTWSIQGWLALGWKPHRIILYYRPQVWRYEIEVNKDNPSAEAQATVAKATKRLLNRKQAYRAKGILTT